MLLRRALVVLLAFYALGCARGEPDRTSTTGDPKDHGTALQDLASVDAFRAEFDSDSAQPRLVLLLSPT